ncbi:MAG: RNA polymerase sigma factor, partial [Clostridium sp.]
MRGESTIRDTIYELVKNDLALIYKYLISIGASREDSEDIVQETFIKVYENIDILIDGNIKAWMFKVSINRFYTLYKKSKASVSLNEDMLNNIKSEFEIRNIDNNLDIKTILSKLTESQKNILILKYSMGLSYREIGKFLDIDEGSSKTICY